MYVKLFEQLFCKINVHYLWSRAGYHLDYTHCNQSATRADRVAVSPRL